MTITKKQTLQKYLSNTWFQATIVFIIALVPRLIALSRPMYNSEPTYADNARRLLLLLGQTSADKLPEMGAFRGVTLLWESAALLYLRYRLHSGQIWPIDASVTVSLSDFVKQLSLLDIIFIMRFSTILTATVGLVLLYLLSRRLWGWQVAVLVTAFVSFDPFYLGLSRLLSTDGHVSTWVFVSLLAFLAYLKKQSIGIAIIIVLATVLAILSKAPAVLLLGFLPLMAIAYSLLMDKIDRSQLKLLLWGLGMVGGIAIVWQLVTWFTGQSENFVTALLRTLKLYANQDTGMVRFWFGQISTRPNWTYYIAVLLARTTPTVILGVLLGIIAIFNLNNKKANQPSNTEINREFIAQWLILALFVGLFTAFVSFSNTKNGRYLLPVFPPLAILAARGLQMFWLWSKQHLPHLPLKIGLTVIAVIHFSGFIFSYPYYTTYYTPLVGTKVVDIIQIGYGEGLDIVANYLNHKPQAEDLNVLSWHGQEVLGPRFKGTTWQPVAIHHDTVVTPQSLQQPSYFGADYVVTYINQIQRQIPNSKLLTYFQNRQAEFTVEFRGIRYASVYPGPIYGAKIPPQATLLTPSPSSAVQLVAYELGSDYALTLFWQTDAPLSADYTVGLKLFDANGQTWGHVSGWPVGGFLPTSLWETGIIVRDDYRLHPLPGTPPGAYLVELTMTDSVTGQALPLTNGEIGPGGGLALYTLNLEQPYIPPATSFTDDDLAKTIPVYTNIPLLNGVTLVGYGPQEWSAMQPGEALPVSLLWQTTRATPAPMQLAWQLVKTETEPVNLGETSPGLEPYPLAKWQKGDIIRDQFSLHLPASLESGIYQLQSHLPNGNLLTMGEFEVIARPHSFEMPPLNNVVTANFGDLIELAGYELTQTAGDENTTLQLSLYWQAKTEMQTAYKFFIHVLDVEGTIIAQTDQEPQTGQAPTNSWVTDEVLIDNIDISINNQNLAAVNSIRIGLYNPTTWQRLPLHSINQANPTIEAGSDYLQLRMEN